MMTPRITRRLNTRRCVTNGTCPAIFELDDGRIAIIGTVAPHLTPHLPAGSGVGPDEDIVIVPRDVLTSAARNLRCDEH